MIKGPGKKHDFLIRIESCIKTILDVKKALESLQMEANILDEVQGIEMLTKEIDVDSLSEREVFMLEEATNRLMDELKPLWASDLGKHIYKEAIH